MVHEAIGLKSSAFRKMKESKMMRSLLAPAGAERA
jgi:hypothetical protein